MRRVLAQGTPAFSTEAMSTLNDPLSIEPRSLPNWPGPIGVDSVRSRVRGLKERLIEGIMFLSAFLSVVVTVGIVALLLYESMGFFRHVPVKDFLTGTEWSPAFANPKYSIWPLLSGTITITLVALSVALPLGTITAIYLSEYAPHKLREALKPVLELLSAVPTVVYGYFALLFVTPLLQRFIPGLGAFNMLSAGLVMGVMIIPYVSSLSEDAMRAVPMSLREGSYAMGSTKMQTAFRVVVPASFSGITAAYILGISRALGETMVVAVAAGQQPSLTFNPKEQAMTITAFIVQVAGGDLPHGSIPYQSIFAAGLVLFLMTLLFNIAGYYLRKKYRQAY
jgi:phosphate transport system permease protein